MKRHRVGKLFVREHSSWFEDGERKGQTVSRRIGRRLNPKLDGYVQLTNGMIVRKENLTRGMVVRDWGAKA